MSDDTDHSGAIDLKHIYIASASSLILIPLAAFFTPLPALLVAVLSLVYILGCGLRGAQKVGKDEALGALVLIWTGVKNSGRYVRRLVHAATAPPDSARTAASQIPSPAASNPSPQPDSSTTGEDDDPMGLAELFPTRSHLHRAVAGSLAPLLIV